MLMIFPGIEMILQSYNDMYVSGNVMGFLGVGDQRLVIESRFSSGDEDYLFQYLLNRVMDFPNLVDLETEAKQDNGMFNLLVFLFPYYLKRILLGRVRLRHIFAENTMMETLMAL